ncbi:MAG: hypothetical protein R3B99_14905 [Polyangiales bacterium]
MNGATVSRRLDAVEKRSRWLFERTARGLVLTDGGRLVVERAERVEARFAASSAPPKAPAIGSRDASWSPRRRRWRRAVALLAELASAHQLELVLREQIGVVSLGVAKPTSPCAWCAPSINGSSRERSA